MADNASYFSVLASAANSGMLAGFPKEPHRSHLPLGRLEKSNQEIIEIYICMCEGSGGPNL
jgi:hypothetical protein